MRSPTKRSALLVGLLALGLGVAGAAGAQDKASQIFLLRVHVAPNSSEELIGPEGPFAVPDNRIFLIRSINVFPVNPAPGLVSIGLEQGPASVAFWNLPMDRPALISYDPGFKINGGSTKVLKIVSPASSDGAVVVDVNGFLVKNK